MTNQSREGVEKMDMGWLEIAKILSKGFLAVHHGKALPIDVIEEVQEKYDKAISQSQEQARQEVLKEKENSMSWCSCGDSLERIDDDSGRFYPENAKYYCFGCDKYYKLVSQKEK